MDRKNRLDAPNNDALNDIEQVSDHSELSTMYFKARDEWEGKDLLSDEQRNAKRDAELLSLRLSVRRQFVILGILIPTPVIGLVILISWAATYLNGETIRSMFLAAILAIVIWLVVSYTATLKVFRIFYDHTLTTLPFIISIITLLGLSTQEIFLLTRPLHTDSFFTNTLIVSAGAYLASIMLTGILLTLWVSPRFSGRTKMALIAVLAVAILVSIFATVL